MQRHLAIVITMFGLSVPGKPDTLNPNISGIAADVRIGNTVEVTRVDEPVFGTALCNFAVKEASSTPPSVILSGRVVSNNSGGAQERVPLFFGSTLHHPRLAALTNVDGEFRFRVWLRDRPVERLSLKPTEVIIGPRMKKSASRLQHWPTRDILQTTTLREATLYLEGDFNKDAEMVSSFTHVYSLRQFLEQSAKQKP